MDESGANLMKIWTQHDQDSERKMKTVLLDGLDAVVRAQSDVLSRIKANDPVAVPVIRWLEEWGYPCALTARLAGDAMTFTGRLFGRAVNAESIGKVVREGTILERPSDGLQVKVSSLDGVSAAVSAYGGTRLADDPAPMNWDIIVEPWSDFRDAAGPRSLDRTFREVGTQIFAETFEMAQTRKTTNYAHVACEMEHQIIALLGKLRRQLAYAALRSRPYHDGSKFVWADKTEQPTMCGLCTWAIVTHEELANPSVYVNKNGQAISKADLDSLVRSLWLDEHADFNRGDWWIVCHPRTSQFIHDFDISHRRVERARTSVGFHVDEFHLKIGKTFPILSEPIMRPGVLIAVNFAAFTYGYYENDAAARVELPTQGRYQRWLISFQTYGLVARNPRANLGLIYNLPAE
jgi:hypothetical protein